MQVSLLQMEEFLTYQQFLLNFSRLLFYYSRSFKSVFKSIHAFYRLFFVGVIFGFICALIANRVLLQMADRHAVKQQSIWSLVL